MHIGSCWLWPPIGNMCTHVSGSDDFLTDDRPGHWDHYSVANSLDAEFAFGVWCERASYHEKDKPKGYLYYFNAEYDNTRNQAVIDNRRFVSSPAKFLLPPGGLVWTTEVPYWIRTREQLAQAVDSDTWWGLRVNTECDYQGPTDCMEDIPILNDLWKGKLGKAAKSSRWKFVNSFWKFRCFATQASQALR